MNDILHELERLSRAYGSHPFFYLQSDGPSRTYSFGQVNFSAAALACELAKRGAAPGSTVVCRSYNSPELVVAVLAAAYGGFDLALLSPHLSSAKYKEAESQLKGLALVIEEADFLRLMLDACGHTLGEISELSGEELNADSERLGLQAYSDERLDAFDPAERGVYLFEANDSALVPVKYSWQSLVDMVQKADALSISEAAVWQLILPLSGIEGFKVLVRSLMNASPVLIYEHYSALRILNDVLPFKVTHISVTPAHLKDLLETNYDGVLCQYHCILVEGAAPTRKLSRAISRAGAKVVFAG